MSEAKKPSAEQIALARKDLLALGCGFEPDPIIRRLRLSPRTVAVATALSPYAPGPAVISLSPTPRRV